MIAVRTDRHVDRLLGYVNRLFRHRPVTVIAGKALRAWPKQDKRQHGEQSQTE